MIYKNPLDAIILIAARARVYWLGGTFGTKKGSFWDFDAHKSQFTWTTAKPATGFFSSSSVLKVVRWFFALAILIKL